MPEGNVPQGLSDLIHARRAELQTMSAGMMPKLRELFDVYDVAEGTIDDIFPTRMIDWRNTSETDDPGAPIQYLAPRYENRSSLNKCFAKGIKLNKVRSKMHISGGLEAEIKFYSTELVESTLGDMVRWALREMRHRFLSQPYTGFERIRVYRINQGTGEISQDGRPDGLLWPIDSYGDENPYKWPDIAAPAEPFDLNLSKCLGAADQIRLSNPGMKIGELTMVCEQSQGYKMLSGQPLANNRDFITASKNTDVSAAGLYSPFDVESSKGITKVVFLPPDELVDTISIAAGKRAVPAGQLARQAIVMARKAVSIGVIQYPEAKITVDPDNPTNIMISVVAALRITRQLDRGIATIETKPGPLPAPPSPEEYVDGYGYEPMSLDPLKKRSPLMAALGPAGMPPNLYTKEIQRAIQEASHLQRTVEPAEDPYVQVDRNGEEVTGRREKKDQTDQSNKNQKEGGPDRDTIL